MIARLGLVISRVFQRTAPDPFILAILLTLLTAALALLLGFRNPEESWLSSRPAAAIQLLDAWRSDNGLWKLLAFGMQMCLILVTGHAIASAPQVRPALDRLARLPRSSASAAALVALVACAAGLVNWGLGLIVGAFLARATGESLARRGIPHHYPLLVAAAYSTMMLWHGGLSGSAPLTVTSRAEAIKVLPAGVVDMAVGEGIPLTQTIFSPLNLFITLGLLVLVPVVAAALAPRRADEMAPFGLDADTGVERGRSDAALTETAGGVERRSLAERLEHSRVLAWTLAIALALGLVRFGQTTGLASVGLNEINGAMLAIGLVLHGSPIRYMRAIEEAASACAGIIIQFPLYAGIMVMMSRSGLVQLIAEGMTTVGSARTVPIFSFVSAGVINLFVPSGGGQWAIQGPIALDAGVAAGVPAGKMVMSVAYGDQLTNMLQPFWALPLLAVTGAKARDIVGYTAILMLVGAAWVALGLLLL